MQRRTFLRAAMIGASTGILGTGLGIDAPALADPIAFAALRQRWRTYLTGGTDYDPTDPVIASKIEDITSTAQAFWDTLNTAASRTYLWTDLASTSNSAHVTSNYSRLRSMATAYCTHGSSLQGNAGLLAAIHGALAWMHDHRFNTTQATYGNWWDWEIGAPTALNDVLCLVYDQTPGIDRTTYLAAVERFSPDPAILHAEYAPTAATSANRVSMCKVVGIRAAIVEDSTKLTAVRNALSEPLAYSDSEDGMHPDGSYLYHRFIPYNGGYGVQMYQKIGELIALLDGTTWEVVDPNRANLADWARIAYAPFLFRGSLLDMVRGREISRNTAQDHLAGHTLVTALVQASAFLDTASANDVRRLVKRVIQSDTYSDYFTESAARIPEIEALRAILDDPLIAPSPEQVGYFQYPSMARAVARRSEFAIGISMHSTRVHNFEMINNENIRGWHTADGVVSLHNSDLGHYSGDYWPTVDPMRLPGTTVVSGSTTTTRRFSDQVWVGGAQISGRYGANGMSHRPFGVDLAAKKSWFTFDEEVVALGAGIRSSAAQAVETIVENRKLLAAGTNPLTIDGTAQPTALGWTATRSASWAHLEGSVVGAGIGYVLPGGATISAKRETRTGRWSDINDRSTTPTNLCTNNFLTIWLDHGVAPTAAAYAYYVLPGKNAAQTASYAAAPGVDILANTTQVQAVQAPSLGIVAANFWTDQTVTVGPITVDQRSSVLVRETNGELELAVADPTHLNRGHIEIELQYAATGLLAADSQVQVLQYTPAIRVAVSLEDTHGRTIRARFATASPGAAPIVSAPARPTTTDVIVDNSDAGFVAESTNWQSRTNTPGYSGADYLVDAGSGADPTMWAMWTPYISERGHYDVMMRWTADANRPDAAPIEIGHAGSTPSTRTVNQRNNGGAWMTLGNYDLLGGTSNYVKIFGGDAGFTVADAVRFVRTGDVISGEYEAEDLPTTVSGGVLTSHVDSSASGGKWVKFTPAAGVGDSLSLEVTVPRAGRFRLRLGGKAHNTRGQFQAYVNGSAIPIGPVVDQYATTEQRRVLDIGEHWFRTAGAHTISLAITGKRAASLGYSLAADDLVLVAL
ncbi:polysaccharide lyase family 8 super-sandwich domain-containing protein [Occultella aeris]|uniref:Xanthan lyase n=1 Tax=Occultella aeris TaxID=2761496 RepID=A0A7M4DGF2_9MICO|nr:polysaccharide lyase family 8 super-sandwich domain-containing protein [Occultella aeris]VZO35995.1 Xanthan lyase precursor [Occultella aeris]